MAPSPRLNVVADVDAPPAPYPANTKTKGWRFELDYERIEQSDTWALATPDMRPWLLMLWLTSWRQTPCGSLPASDDLIAARIGMDRRQFVAHRDILMRGWHLAADGRLYHITITEQVLGLIGCRERETERKKNFRERLAVMNQQLDSKCPTGQPWESRVRPVGATLPEPEPEPEKNTKTPPTPSKGERAPDGFANFWAAWPATARKVGKKAAQDKWARKGYETQSQVIVAHVEAMKNTKQWQDGYEPAPLTYLNQERWQDGVPDASQDGDMSDINAMFARAGR